MVSVMTFNELVSTYARHLKVVGEEDQETSPGETSTWSTFNRIRTPIALPFVLAGAPGQARRFELELAVNLPEDARLFLRLPAAAAGALPSM